MLCWEQKKYSYWLTYVLALFTCMNTYTQSDSCIIYNGDTVREKDTIIDEIREYVSNLSKEFTMSKQLLNFNTELIRYMIRSLDIYLYHSIHTYTYSYIIIHIHTCVLTRKYLYILIYVHTY